MTLTRWDPFRDLLGLQGRINQMLAEAPARQNNDVDVYGSWAPAVDIFERGDDLVIRAELPGVSSKDIDVHVENNTLHLGGARAEDAELKEGRAYRRERVFGTFSRSFALPTTVDAAKIAARHDNGVLEIVLPKLEQAKPRRVTVQVA
jgi:HSP20 family protein